MTIGKIIKIVTTRCQILRLKCTKFNFGWGSVPDPTGGAYSAPPNPLAGLRGPTSKGRERDGKKRERGREGTGKGGEGRGEDRRRREGEGSLGDGRGRDPTPSRPPNPFFWIRPCEQPAQTCICRCSTELVTQGVWYEHQRFLLTFLCMRH